MNNGSAPATKQDLADLRAELKQDMTDLKTELLAADAGRTTELKEELLEAIREANSQLMVELKTELKDELLEAMHDMETRLLKGFYGYTESNQKHLNQLDREDISIRERLGTLEERVKELERRVNFPRSNS